LHDGRKVRFAEQLGEAADLSKTLRRRRIVGRVAPRLNIVEQFPRAALDYRHLRAPLMT
jgi:hypothetical protein